MEPKALPSGDGMSGFHGRPGEGMGHMLGEGGGGGGGKLSSWIGRLAGTRDTRRGSLGFSDSGINLTTPLARIDDDNDSNDTLPPGFRPDGLSIDRRRSYTSDMMNTPGGDGDTFIMHYRRQTEVGGQDSNLLTYSKDDGLMMDIEPSKPSITDSIYAMEPILEGRILQQTDFKMDPSLEREYKMETAHPGGSSTIEFRPEETLRDNAVFLVDLEKMDDGIGVKLKPNPKKFSLTSVLQSNWAQNWFIKNGEDEEAAQDGLDEDGERSRSNSVSRKGSTEKNPKKISEEYNRITGESTRRNSDLSRRTSPQPEDVEQPLNFIGKFKRAVEEHPKPLRNMNTWEPQSF
jgi:hypothetical protein